MNLALLFQNKCHYIKFLRGLFAGLVFVVVVVAKMQIKVAINILIIIIENISSSQICTNLC